MKQIRPIIAIFFLSILSSIGTIQAQDSIVPKKIVVKALVKPGAISLRWVVTDKYAWKYSNEFGFIVERTTVLRDGKPLLKPERVILSGDTIKPQPPEAWKAIIDDNDMAAIAAQAIYGESFEVNNNEEKNPVFQVFYESEELERRFGFSLFAMDRDFKVAQLAGLGYVDTQVKENEKYLYRVKSAIPKERMVLEASGVYLAAKEIEPLPQPIDFLGYYYKNAFVLVWEYDALLPFYSAYQLERSVDNKIFESINEVPITKLSDTPYSGVSYTDSIPEYGKKFWYRLVGLSYFGQKSPPSKSVALIGFKKIKSEPLFTSTKITEENTVELIWSFPEEEQWKLNKYELLRAERAVGPYQTVIDSIAPDQKNIIYGPLSDINYFKLKAFGKHGDGRLSPPAMVQPIDSIPPVQPQDLKGSIDTLGIVTLTWKKNEELDLKGYNLVRAYRKNQEFTRLNKENLLTQSFIDSIDLTSFDQNVYYRLLAVDNRYNESKPSNMLILQKPDRIPPTTPVFKDFKIKNNTVALSWVNSSSLDWAKTVLYRKEVGDTIQGSFKKIYETSNDTITAFTDIKIKPGTKYHYTLLTVDQSGLESEPAPPAVLDIPAALLKPGTKGLYATVNREKKFIELTWRFNETDAIDLKVYRKTQEDPFSLYKHIPPKERRFIDTNLTLNTTYTYAFKAVFKDGSISEWEEIEVRY